jgi:LPXTG-site transpeptidase (sortase) family protein
VRSLLRAIGTLLLVGSGLGLAGLGWMWLTPESDKPWPSVGPASIARALFAAPPAPGTQLASANPGPRPAGTLANPAVLVQPVREITRIEIPAIDLASDVVPAGLVERDGGLTWEVPAFKVGHAASTAGAGQRGNAVLLGHVTSIRSGNVFQDLARVQVGQTVRVFAETRQFEYTVVSSAHVGRTDSSVLEQSSTPAISLVTCTGVWLPTIWDYTERLVVRAELSQDQIDRP